MTAVIALFNQSGGVGKSTLTMNLGYLLNMLNNRVLLIDMDPQVH
jgi:chromosome partitioning protein